MNASPNASHDNTGALSAESGTPQRQQAPAPQESQRAAAPPAAAPEPSGQPRPGPRSSAEWYPAPSAPEPRRKSPALACFLSVVPGLGQVYWARDRSRIGPVR